MVKTIQKKKSISQSKMDELVKNPFGKYPKEINQNKTIEYGVKFCEIRKRGNEYLSNRIQYEGQY